LLYLSPLIAIADVQLEQVGGYDVSILRVILSLFFCLLLAVGGIFALRHHLQFKNRTGILWRAPELRRLEIVEQLTIGPQKSICLLTIDGNDYVVVFSVNAVSLTPIITNSGTPE
jgi:flagellar biogenesis protein FliO